MSANSVRYANVTNVKISEVTEYQKNKYRDRLGYSLKCGVPTDYMVQIDYSKTWYRVKCYQISNSGTLFIKTKNNPFLVVDGCRLFIHGKY
jgi:hypothetical protein